MPKWRLQAPKHALGMALALARARALGILCNQCAVRMKIAGQEKVGGSVKTKLVHVYGHMEARIAVDA